MNIRVGAAATLSNGIVANLKNVDDAATINHGLLSIENTFFNGASAFKNDGK